MIYLLLLIFLLILYFTYIKFGKDLMAPAFLYIGGYTLSIFCATMNVDNWNISLHPLTCIVLIIGSILFIVPAYFYKKRYDNNVKKFENTFIEIINVNQKYLKVYCVLQFLFIFIWLGMIYSIISTYKDFNSYSQMMILFREWSGSSTKWINNYLFFFLNQINVIFTTGVYFFLYVFVYNIISSSKLINNKFLIITIGLSIVQMLLNGGRSAVLHLILAGILFYFTFYLQKNGHRLILSLKKFAYLLIFMIAGAIIFYLSKSLVGRPGSFNLEEFIPYITMYVGGPIQLLDMYLINPIPSSDIFGKETFYGLNFQFARWGITDIEPYISHLEFRMASTGAFLGNIYTSYRSYIYDFGYIGFILLTLLFSLIMNNWYYSAINNCKKINYSLIFYSWYFHSIFFDFVRNWFFCSLSFSDVKTFVIIFLLSTLFLNNKKDKIIKYN